MGKAMKRAAIYLRVSTQDQTTANQEHELRQAAERANWQVARVPSTRSVTYCVRAFSGKPANACPVMNALGRRTPCARTSFPAIASIAFRKIAFRIRRIGILP